MWLAYWYEHLWDYAVIVFYLIKNFRVSHETLDEYGPTQVPLILLCESPEWKQIQSSLSVEGIIEDTRDMKNTLHLP